jgi:hypothetical protein
MDWKKGLLTCTEVWTGAALLAAGVLAQAAGLHGVLAHALAPFGIGLILSDVLTKAGRAAHERVRVRRDDE